MIYPLKEDSLYFNPHLPQEMTQQFSPISLPNSPHILNYIVQQSLKKSIINSIFPQFPPPPISSANLPVILCSLKVRTSYRPVQPLLTANFLLSLSQAPSQSPKCTLYDNLYPDTISHHFPYPGNYHRALDHSIASGRQKSYLLLQRP